MSGSGHRTAYSIRMLYAAIIVVMTVARLCWLESVPPGFFLDEASSVLNAMCVAEQGTDALHGQRYPVYFETDFGGINAPTYVYAAAVADRVFGRSRHTFRAISAWSTLLTTIAVGAVAYALFGRSAAAWSFLAATVSPWGFQYSRIGWENPLYPMFMMWGIFLLLTARGEWRGAAGGIVLSLAAYSYGPARCAVPLMFGATWLYRAARREFQWPAFLASVLFLGTTCFTMIESMTAGSLNARWHYLSIFRDLPAFGVWGVGLSFAHNVLLHFSWSFLFTHGDPLILRHTTGHLGLWSWLDGIGVVLGVGFLIAELVRRFRRPLAEPIGVSPPAVTFLLFGVLAGITPAALTWDSLPHSLRAIGTWPFVALLAGYGMSVASRYRPSSTALAGIVLTSLFVERYLWVYFVAYPADLRRPENMHWFSLAEYKSAKRAQYNGSWERFRDQEDVPYPLRRMYLMFYADQPCEHGIKRSGELDEPFGATPLGRQLKLSALVTTLFAVVVSLRRRTAREVSPQPSNPPSQ